MAIINCRCRKLPLFSTKNRITNQSNVEELDLFQDGIQSLLKPINFQKKIEEFSDANLKNLNQRIDRLGTIYNIRLSQGSQYGLIQILPQHQSTYLRGPESASIEIPPFRTHFIKVSKTWS